MDITNFVSFFRCNSTTSFAVLFCPLYNKHLNKKKLSPFYNLFIFFLISTSLYAISLKELLNSIESNDSYQSKLSYVEKSKKEYESASTHIYPNIDMVGNYENNTKVYTDEAKSNVNGELKASYTLYDGEKLKNNELSKIPRYNDCIIATTILNNLEQNKYINDK